MEVKEEDHALSTSMKMEVEKEDHAFFYSRNSDKNRSYYECHRSGSSRSASTHTRMKWADSKKIEKNCSARIVATHVEDKIHVHIQRTHFGQTQSIRFLRLTKDERDELASKINMGVTFNRILSDIRDTAAAAGIG